MGEELTRSLRMLAERGEERGSQAVLEYARAEAVGARAPGRPTWRRGLVVALGTAVGVLVLIGAAILLARPFGGEELPPATTEAPVVPTTVPVTPPPITDSSGPLNDISDLALADDSLWAATAAGLVRWDVATGEFEILTESDGIPGRSVETIQIASDGTVWIVTDWAIGRYNGSWQVYSADNTPELDGQLGDLVVDNDGVVWVAVASEPLARFDGSWSSVSEPEGPGRSVVGPEGLAVGADGTMWVGTLDEGVFAFDGATWQHFTDVDGVPERAWHIAVAPDGAVWSWDEGYYTSPDLEEFVPGTGFARYDGSTWIRYTVHDGLLSNEGYVAVTTDGSVAVVHREWGPDHEEILLGMSRFDGDGWTTESTGSADSVGPIGAAAVGADGIVWMPSADGIRGFSGVETYELIVPEALATPPIRPFTLTPDPESTPVRVSTVLGDFEFTTLRAPGHDVFDTETTPFGWMALGGDAVWRSHDGLTWDAVLAGAEDLWIMADGPDLIAYGWGLARYSWDGAGWSEVATAELPGRIQGLAFGPSGAVALVDNIVYYSTDGVTFAPAEAGPDLAPVSGRLGCAGWWPESSVAGPGGGPILVTDSGYVLLAPSFGTWDLDPLPLCEPRAWFSTDGDRWELLTPESPFGESAVADIAVHSGRFVAIGGNDVWVSDDGSEWRPAEVPQLRDAKGIAGGDLGWVLVGVAADPDTSGLPTAMWFSVDGLIWDGPYTGPEGLGYVYFHIEPTVGSDMIVSVNGTHDGFVIGRLED